MVMAATALHWAVSGHKCRGRAGMCMGSTQAALLQPPHPNAQFVLCHQDTAEKSPQVPLGAVLGCTGEQGGCG